jgi:hypothetical protein
MYYKIIIFFSLPCLFFSLRYIIEAFKCFIGSRQSISKDSALMLLNTISRKKRAKSSAVLVISSIYRKQKTFKSFFLPFYLYFVLLLAQLQSIQSTIHPIYLLYVLLKCCSPQFYVWCIVVMTCVFCTAG